MASSLRLALALLALAPWVLASPRGQGQSGFHPVFEELRLLKEKVARNDVALSDMRRSEKESDAKMELIQQLVEKQRVQIIKLTDKTKKQDAKMFHLLKLTRKQKAKISSMEQPIDGKKGGQPIAGCTPKQRLELPSEADGTRLLAQEGNVSEPHSNPRPSSGSQRHAGNNAYKQRRVKQPHGQPGRGGQHEDDLTSTTRPAGAVDPNRNRKEPGLHIRAKRSDDPAALQAALAHVSQEVTQLSARVTAMAASVQQAAASSFVQWGSSSCTAAAASLVYSGVMGGSWFEHTGAATNYLCLTLKPNLSDHVPPRDDALLYGAEYDMLDSHMDEDAVCAVCRAAFPITVVVPGTDRCEAGWQLQYSGYLMTGNPDHRAGSEYICVDSRLESRVGSKANDNGKQLKYTLTRCGSLPCGPYHENKIVTCAVCSK